MTDQELTLTDIQATSDIADDWCKQLPYQFDTNSNQFSSASFNSHEIKQVAFSGVRYLLPKVCNTDEYPQSQTTSPVLKYEIYALD